MDTDFNGSLDQKTAATVGFRVLHKIKVFEFWLGQFYNNSAHVCFIVFELANDFFKIRKLIFPYSIITNRFESYQTHILYAKCWRNAGMISIGWLTRDFRVNIQQLAISLTWNNILKASLWMILINNFQLHYIHFSWLVSYYSYVMTVHGLWRLFVPITVDYVLYLNTPDKE